MTASATLVEVSRIVDRIGHRHRGVIVLARIGFDGGIVVVGDARSHVAREEKRNHQPGFHGVARISTIQAITPRRRKCPNHARAAREKASAATSRVHSSCVAGATNARRSGSTRRCRNAGGERSEELARAVARRCRRCGSRERLRTTIYLCRELRVLRVRQTRFLRGVEPLVCELAVSAQRRDDRAESVRLDALGIDHVEVLDAVVELRVDARLGSRIEEDRAVHPEPDGIARQLRERFLRKGESAWKIALGLCERVREGHLVERRLWSDGERGFAFRDCFIDAAHAGQLCALSPVRLVVFRWRSIGEGEDEKQTAGKPQHTMNISCAEVPMPKPTSNATPEFMMYASCVQYGSFQCLVVEAGGLGSR